MSIRISTAASMDLAKDAAVVRVNEGGIWIWPQGIGVGPMIVMDEADWDELVARVAAARSATALDLLNYSATEGNGDAL